MFKNLLFIFFLLIKSSFAITINIVAAENFYGELAQEIGGSTVVVHSIINSSSIDPHLFNLSLQDSLKLTHAQIIIYNGLAYDAWINPFLKKNNNEINVADLVTSINLTNPHIWYKPETFPKLATVIANKLIQLNPSSHNLVTTNLNKFLQDYRQINNKIYKIKQLYNHTPVIATENIYNYMTEALGFKMQGLDLQLKIMNDTEPSPKIIIDYQQQIKSNKLKLMYYNSQILSVNSLHLIDLARLHHLMIIAITETMPQNKTIVQWMEEGLNNTFTALNHD